MGSPGHSHVERLTTPDVASADAGCQNSARSRAYRTGARAPTTLRDPVDAVPTYDYQCRSCGQITEVVHPMTEEGPTTCERCGGQLRRVLYPTSIIFKGSGFYSTDSRSSSNGSRRGSGSAGGTGSGPERKETGSTGEKGASGGTDKGSSGPKPGSSKPAG